MRSDAAVDSAELWLRSSRASSLLASTPAFNPSSAGAQSIQLPTLALATVISVLPVLVVFLFSQRFLVRGMTAGGVKE